MEHFLLYTGLRQFVPLLLCCTDADPQAEWSAGLGHTQGSLTGASLPSAWHMELGKTRHAAPHQARQGERINGLKPHEPRGWREKAQQSSCQGSRAASLAQTCRGGEGCAGSQNPLRMEKTPRLVSPATNPIPPGPPLTHVLKVPHLQIFKHFQG